MGAWVAALFAVGWCGMMRSSELVAMQWEDVRLDEQGVRIRVPKSKTDSRGAGSWVFLAATSASGAASGTAPFCPAQLLRTRSAARFGRWCVGPGVPGFFALVGRSGERHGVGSSAQGLVCSGVSGFGILCVSLLASWRGYARGGGWRSLSSDFGAWAVAFGCLALVHVLCG